MFPSNFPSNDSLPWLTNSLTSIDSGFSNHFGPTTTRLELYPRRRYTEFYVQPQPLQEFQSRTGEHPRDKLPMNCLNMTAITGIPGIPDVPFPTRINPPRNSDMRMFRNSYFS